MNRLLWCFIVFFVPNLESRCQTSCDTIYWKENVKLQWSHFKAKPDTNRPMTAISSPGIAYSASFMNDSLRVAINCNFLTCVAWTKSNASNLLKHEQTHFDIAEYVRRLLIQKLIATRINSKNSLQALGNIYGEYIQIQIDLDKEYDEKTDYSRDTVMQDQWTKDIRAKIALLKAFSKSQLIIPTYP
jgi:hypothetical protein